MAHPPRPKLPLAALLLLPLLLATGCRRAEGPRERAAPLRIATYSAPLALDPHLKNEVLTFSILGNVFDALVSFDTQLRVRPALATSWENPNDLTWRFHLRPGVRFHDGRPLTADDVVASLERARHHPRSGVANYLVNVDRVRKLDAGSVEITTRQPSPVLLNKLTFISIVPRDAPEEIRHPIGTGPYRFVSMDARRIVLRAFAGSWRGPAPVSEVEMAIVPDGAARASMLARGEVDIIQDVQPELSDRVERCRGCRLLAAEGLLVEYLGARPDTPPFADVRVRRAISLAIDRAALVAQHLRGHGLPIGQLVGRQVFGYTPDLQPPGRDVAGARRLLAEAGLPDGFAVDLEFREGRGADVLVRQLADVGIRVRPVARPWPEMYRRLQEGKVPFYFGGVLAGSADASDVFDSKVHSRDPVHGYGDGNWTGFADVELDRLIEGSATTMDMLQRRAQLQAVMRRLMEELPLIPLDNPYTLFGVREGLRWEPRRDARLELFDVRPAGDRR